jgi:signal transduction histidine kinase
LLNALSPHLSTLVESQDRPEILRVLESVVENRDLNLLVVQNGQILASTRGLAEMDQPYRSEKSIRVLGLKVSGENVLSETDVRRHDAPELGAKLISLTPLKPLVKNTLLIGLVTLLMGIALSAIAANETEKAIRRALKPLETLEKAIHSITHAMPSHLPELEIEELESIRKTILKAHSELENAKESLAQEKAKKLSAEAYRRLIHDLHNPVAALRQMLKVATSASTSENDRDEAIQSMPRIADQILNQVTAAKSDLENDPVALRELDIRKCVEDSVNDIKSSLAPNGKAPSLTLPEAPVMVAHDPSLLQRAIRNLIENGIEACRQQVSICLENIGGIATVSVSDDGHGIENGDATIFLQGRGKSKKGNRQALGLVSTNHIVRTHGGKLIYKKAKLGGASFEIKLEALC